MKYKITREFNTVSEASSWFRAKGYIHWYANTIKDPKYALEGLKYRLGLNDEGLTSNLNSDKIVIGKCEGTYLIFYK